MNEGKEGEGLTAGAVIGDRYRIIAKIGEGGMGRVFLAEDLRLKGQRWAVKWVPRDESAPRLPDQEAAIMTSLQHPSLPRIVDYIVMEDSGGCCLVMDYLEGETLLQRSAAFEHALPWTTVIHYAAQLCDLLDYLHSLDSPIVFRDMKPSNVIVGPDDRVRLIDFGIARTYKEGKGADTVHVGSVGFAAPELLANRQTDHRADLYSLGCLLYFLLSGGEFYNFTKKAIEQAATGVPEALSAVISKLLADEPNQRFPNAKAAKAALLRVEKGDPPESPLRERRPSASAAGKRTIVTVFGLFPNAGATFIAVALAKLIAERGLWVTYCEFPWASGDPFMRMMSVMKGGAPHWQEGHLTWRIAEANRDGQQPSRYEASALYKLLFEMKGDIVIFDLSSSSDAEAAEAMILASDIVAAVAAPDPAGLRSEAAVNNWALLNGSAEPERICWIANRMPLTLKLPEFYKLFSMKPLGYAPELNYDKIMKAKWSGRWIADEPEFHDILGESLKPLLQRVAPGAESGRSLREAAKRWLANKLVMDYNKDKFNS